MSVAIEPERLRELFLFADLSHDQLTWIADHADQVRVPAGAEAYTEGEPATCFYVLLSGRLSMSRLVHGDPVEINRTDQRGVYCGAVQFYLADEAGQRYGGTVRAVTDCEFLALPAEQFAAAFARWYPMAVHLLQGMALGRRNTDAMVGARERLLALGKLTAGLTHELNNPAAAAVRATGALRERVAGMRHKLAMLASGDLPVEQLTKLVGLQEEFVARVAKAPSLTAMAAADREDELADWCAQRGVADGPDLAPVLVAGGVTAADLELLAADTGERFLQPALRWLAYTVETETLMNEIAQSTERISALVGSARQYSQLDRAQHRDVDLHEGLDSTLVMLSAKIGPDVRVVTDYDRSLPPVPAFAAELNQVWTNLIDNAVQAMDGSGTLTLRTAFDGDRALVEIADTGSGVPSELTDRIFEPFFTTRPVGRGTGLGLDVSWRIVVKRHHGDLTVHSVPGDTRFQVRLPLTAPDH